MKHLEFGKPWHLGGLRSTMLVLQPRGASDGMNWYKGNADAVWQNIHVVEERKPRAVLILAGDHIYKMDYRPLLEFHQASRAALTVAVKRVNQTETSMLGTCTLDNEQRIVEFEEKSSNPKSNLASMGIYVFEPEALKESLTRDADNETSTHDFGKDIIPWLVNQGKAFAYEFKGYWRDVGTIDSYFEANMDLLSGDPGIDLADPDWPILTSFDDNPPAHFAECSTVVDSLVCDGAIIMGRVEHSIISPGVVVESDAIVRNSIVFADCRIEQGAKLHLTIVDKNSLIGANSKVGSSVDFTPNRYHASILRSGITIIGRGTCIPPESTIGRNCVVAIAAATEGPLRVPSGTYLDT